MTWSRATGLAGGSSRRGAVTIALSPASQLARGGCGTTACSRDTEIRDSPRRLSVSLFRDSLAGQTTLILSHSSASLSSFLSPARSSQLPTWCCPRPFASASIHERALAADAEPYPYPCSLAQRHPPQGFQEADGSGPAGSLITHPEHGPSAKRVSAPRAMVGRERSSVCEGFISSLLPALSRSRRGSRLGTEGGEACAIHGILRMVCDQPRPVWARSMLRVATNVCAITLTPPPPEPCINRTCSMPSCVDPGHHSARPSSKIAHPRHARPPTRVDHSHEQVPPGVGTR